MREVTAIKKPMPVQAVQVLEDTVVKTLEGDLIARKDDWIITGVDNEQWPVKNEIFEKTYEVID